MIKILPTFAEFQQEGIDKMLAYIVEKTDPEKIVFFGLRTNISHQWSSFLPKVITASTTAIDLLVITSQKDKRNRDRVSNVINDLRSDEFKINAVVHSLDAVNIGIEKGNPFFVTLYDKGVLVYENSFELLSPPNSKTTTIQTTRKLALAQSFYETACDCISNERFEAAAFLFHQCAELACADLLQARLGYRSTTHSLAKLFDLSENITEAIRHLFPASTKEEIELFEILHRAYGEVRYKPDYSIKADTAYVLMERIGDLLQTIEDLIQDHSDFSEVVTQGPIAEFNTISVCTTADIVLHKGKFPNVSIDCDGDKSVFTYRVENGRLYLSINNELDSIIPYAIIHVTYSSLNGFVVDSSGRVSCSETIESDFIGIVQNGKGSIELSVEVLSLDATLTKGGPLEISGSALKAVLLNTGESNLDASKLDVSEASVTIKGSGNVSIHVEDELSVHRDGPGLFELTGEPRIKFFKSI